MNICSNGFRAQGASPRTGLRRLGAVALLCTSAASSNAVDLADGPQFSSVPLPGNLIMALSVEWPTATTPAYPSTTPYTAAAAFLGYFDPDKCYSYTVVKTGTGSSADYSGSYFAPSGPAASHACAGSGANPLWSGNYLNWASMQTLDAFRWVLTGGYRSVDAADTTILTKTLAARDSSVMPQKTVVASTLAGATPFSGATWTTGATTRLRNLGTRMWITGTATGKSSLVAGSTTSVAVVPAPGTTPTGAVPYTGQSSYAGGVDAPPGQTYELYINVKVCDASAGLESNCVAYARGAKPEGLMQAYSSKLRYSAFGYYNDSGDASRQRDGGVMRARMKYIGPAQPVPGSGATTSNALAEWSSSTGVMVANPDSSDASDTVSRAAKSGWTVSIANSGVMNYLNKFGYSAKSYKSKDPVSELYYAALRYFKKLPNVSSYTDLSGAGSSGTAGLWLDGFPAITDWDDPILCPNEKNFILGIGDVNTHRDANLPGSTLRSSLEPALPGEVVADVATNVTKSTNMVGQLEGFAGLGGIYGDSGTTSCAGTSSECDTYYIAGLAFDAHTKDIRGDKGGTRTVNTYWMDVEENQIYKHKNQYWLAAKYGGFDVPSSFNPDDAGNGTSTIPESAWHTSTDTLAPSSGAAGPLKFSTDAATDKRPDNYFPGDQPATMLSGLTAAFDKIGREAAAAHGSAFSVPSPNVTSSGAVSYAASFDPKTWSGIVIASTTGFDSDGAPTLTPRWDARALLNAPGVSATTRRIVTCCTASATSPGLPFTATALGSTTLNARTYVDSFKAVPGVAATSQSTRNFVAYLRGDASNEVANGGGYRNRAFRLGDILDSKPVAVGAPNALYYDLYNPGYGSFKSSHLGRKTVVYVGANDGMLHAFDGTVGATDSGSELFAYIPSLVYGDSRTAAATGIASLGNPSFTHHDFVDATPAQFDVDLNRRGTPDWHTLLIGGLGKGGKGYYAIDVTDPSSWSTETDVASKVLWEFTDPRMGYTYGQPSVVKTKRYGWVVIFTSGYNNSDGVGYFFIVNPADGSLLKAIATPGGSPSAPINLGQNTAFVADYHDMTADAVYAGDLQGDVWRLDVSGTDDYSAPTLLAKLTDAAGNPQPVTARPLIEIEPNSGVRYVLVGTGRMLADSDISSNQVQSFYGIVDGTGATGGFYRSATLPKGESFPIQRAMLNPDPDLLKGIGTAPASGAGWVADLPAGQRVNVDPVANSGVVAFIGNLPNGSDCTPDGTGTLYAVRFANGKSVLTDGGVLMPSAVPIPGILTDLAILNVDDSLHLYAGGKSGTVALAPANLSTATGMKQLNWRDVPLVN